MAAPSEDPPDRDRERASRMGERYFVLGMAVQVGLVGLVGLALVGVQGLGFLSLGTAVALAGLAIGVLAVGTIMTLASLRYTTDAVHEHDERLDRLAARVHRLAEELQLGEGTPGWESPELGEQGPPRHPQREGHDPRERRPAPGPGSGPDPLEGGRIHPISAVPDVEDEEAERLEEMDIEDTGQLWAADPSSLARELDVDPDRVETWQSAAELMAVDAIDPNAAGLLARAGVASIEELEGETPERLVRRVRERPVGPESARQWIEAARAQSIETRRPGRREV